MTRCSARAAVVRSSNGMFVLSGPHLTWSMADPLVASQTNQKLSVVLRWRWLIARHRWTISFFTGTGTRTRKRAEKEGVETHCLPAGLEPDPVASGGVNGIHVYRGSTKRWLSGDDYICEMVVLIDEIRWCRSHWHWRLSLSTSISDIE